jgi:hypothetical protein
VPVVKFAAAARGAKKKKEVVARAVFPNLRKKKVAAVEAGSSVDEDEGEGDEEDEDGEDDEDDEGGQQGERKSKRVRVVLEEGEGEE